MDSNLIDVIWEHYMQNHSEIVDTHEASEETEFVDELVERVSEYDFQAGSELENKFFLAASAAQKRSYRNGFKSGIHFLLGCIELH